MDGVSSNVVFEVDDSVEIVEATPSSLAVDPESGEGTASTNAAPRTVPA